MSSLEELISIERERNAPAKPEPTRIQKLIASARDMQERNWEGFEVVLGGESVDVKIGQISGRDWVQIADRHPPRSSADAALGWNRDTLPRDYPVERIKLRGEHPTVELWQEIYDYIDADGRKAIASVVWWLNWGQAEQRRTEMQQTANIAGERTPKNP